MDGTANENGGPVLLSGATGFLGMELLARYLEHSDRTVYALVRAGSERKADERLRKIVASLVPPGPHTERAVAVRADLERFALGIDSRRRDRLAARVDEVVHCAASVSFGLPLDESRAINVDGTRRMLDFAQLCQHRGGLDGFTHVSTAYVAGTHRGRFGEDELDTGQSFRNPYERSKLEAERLVRERAETLPVQVFRPSIVMGDSRTGWTPAFNVLYWPLKAYARGSVSRVLPARRSAPLDVVPVDYVADALFALAGRSESAGRTYHLTSGAQAATVGELFDQAAAYFRRPRPRALPPPVYRRLVHPLLSRGGSPERRRWLERAWQFFPYMSVASRYDDSAARAALDPVDVRPAPFVDTFERWMDFAVAAEWGRSPISRVEAAGRVGDRDERAPSPPGGPKRERGPRRGGDRRDRSRVRARAPA